MIQSDVRDRLTDEILFGALEHGGTVRIGLKDNTLSFEFDSTAKPATAGAAAETVS